MSPRKLTEDDKHSMLELYRNSKATTSTLAEEFGVSSSTVSRFLKNSLSSEEYENLIQQKRLARTPRGDRSNPVSDGGTKQRAKVSKEERKQPETDSPEVETAEKPSKQIILPQKTIIKVASDTETATTSVRPRQSEPMEEIVVELIASEEESAIESPQIETETKPEIKIKPVEKTKPEIKIKTEDKISLKSLDEDDEDDEDDDDLDVVALSAMLGEEIGDDEDDEDDEDDDRDEDRDEDISYTYTNSKSQNLEILPLSAASFPRTCYLVVDRAAELIAKPLQEFADLGTIPIEEIEQKTLPVFDNHRIAKRFSHRREKVIKVPDGAMLQKTASYLHEKGITRLLIRGQIYAISGD